MWSLFFAVLFLCLLVSLVFTGDVVRHRIVQRNQAFVAWATQTLQTGQVVLVKRGEHGFYYSYTDIGDSLYATKKPDGRIFVGSPMFDGQIVIPLSTNESDIVGYLTKNPWFDGDGEWYRKALVRADILRSFADENTEKAKTFLKTTEEHMPEFVPWRSSTVFYTWLRCDIGDIIGVRVSNSAYFVIPFVSDLCMVAVYGSSSLLKDPCWVTDEWLGHYDSRHSVLQALGIAETNNLLEKTGAF